ncbi:MAG TPA: YceD family protein [Cellvibrionaceae bacterium]
MSQPPSNKALPRYADARKFAQQQLGLAGQIDVALMSRLHDLLANDNASAEVVLSFGRDGEGRKVVTGTADANIMLVCQRCLEPVEVNLRSDIALAIVWSEDQATGLPKYLDPWILDEGAADLYEMIEEELLLALPAVAYHAEPCVPEALFQSGEPAAEKTSVERNPFQVLEQLKGSPKTDD